jgi:hypothetical protein
MPALLEFAKDSFLKIEGHYALYTIMGTVFPRNNYPKVVLLAEPNRNV